MRTAGVLFYRPGVACWHVRLDVHALTLMTRPGHRFTGRQRFCRRQLSEAPLSPPRSHERLNCRSPPSDATSRRT